MSKTDGVFIFIGTYASEVDARADYEVVKELHAMGAVGTYDAAVVTKDEAGKVHVNKDETTTRHGAWGGAGVGALVGRPRFLRRRPLSVDWSTNRAGSAPPTPTGG